MSASRGTASRAGASSPRSSPHSSPRSSTTSRRRSARLNPRPVTYADTTSTPSSERGHDSGINGSGDPKLRQRSESADDGSVLRTPTKKRRMKGEKTLTLEGQDELLLRRTCEGLGIDYSLFDDWVEDPRGKKIQDMKIPFLPNEIMLQIFNGCRPETLVECMNASKRFRDLLNENTRIWRQARRNHYPGLPETLPLGLDEYELFDLTTGRGCDYCETKKKVRPYYIWSVRCCQECIQTLTLCASDFKRMLKRKVGNSSDWDAHKRELICYTIRWQDLPTGARICWKEEAYTRINEAEEMVLEDRFEEWIPTVTVRCEQRETFWFLEDWGAGVPKTMKRDRDEQKAATRKARKDLYLTWCWKVLPKPIPGIKMEDLSTYNVMANKPGFLTKKEFILSLPRLIRDNIRLDDETCRHKALERQSRLKHEDLLESTVQQVMHALIRDGSAKNWGAIVREQVKAAAAAKVELRYPKDTPESVMRDWRWRCNDLGIALLYRFAKLVEQALNPENSSYKDLLHPSVFEFFENQEDRIFTCHGLSVQFSYIGPTFRRCCHKELMTLTELAEHFMEKGIYQADLTHLIVGKWEYMIKIATALGPKSSSHRHHRNANSGRQNKISTWLQRRTA